MALDGAGASCAVIDDQARDLLSIVVSFDDGGEDWQFDATPDDLSTLANLFEQAARIPEMEGVN